MRIKKKLQKLIEIPLRFHHQDIHQELGSLKAQLDRIEDLLRNKGETK